MLRSMTICLLIWLITDSTPQALFITCSDSRVVPNLLTNTGPGDLFVVRNIGNFVPPYVADGPYRSVIAAIEYAVSALKVPEIIVCGHTQCGAVEALHKGAEGNEFRYVRKWLELGESVKKEAKFIIGKEASEDELMRLTEKLNVLHQIENLMTYSYVKKAVDAGELTLHGWLYDIKTGDIEYYDFDTKAFQIYKEIEEEHKDDYI